MIQDGSTTPTCSSQRRWREIGWTHCGVPNCRWVSELGAPSEVNMSIQPSGYTYIYYFGRGGGTCAHVCMQKGGGEHGVRSELSLTRRQVSWVWFSATTSLFTFLYLHLITSNMYIVVKWKPLTTSLTTSLIYIPWDSPSNYLIQWDSNCTH